MKPKAAAFYWTLPVPWAGFSAPFKDVEDAAKRSRTVRCQRALVHRWVRLNGFDLVREEAFLELRPDRGSAQILDPVRELADYARETGATLLYADFSELANWRSHMVLDDWMRRLGSGPLAHMPVPIEPVEIDGEWFDPRAHFEDWRDRQAEWTAGKDARVAAARAAIAELVAQGRKWKEIAAELEKRGLATRTGVRWKGESARKLHAKGVGPKA